MKKIAIAMSGGVDSSVAAYLLESQGDRLGLTMHLFAPCGGKDGERDARQVADFLGFPHKILDFSTPFQQEVMEHFVSCYEGGETPNPCIVCNRRIKFGKLLDCAVEEGCDTMATGHYARVEQDAGTGRYLLKKAVHPEKDQSYFLYSLNQYQLSRIQFPLGELAKPEIRAIAEERGLVNAKRGDSQDVCFIPDGDYGAFIRKFRGRDYPEGDFITPTGIVLGRHSGIVNYTVGQRRGLGVSADSRLYVKELRLPQNQVVLSTDQELFSGGLVANQLNLIATERLTAPIRCGVRIRSAQSEQWATVEQTGEDTIVVRFDQAQRAIAAGQAVVLYDGDTVIGGAVIQGALA